MLFLFIKNKALILSLIIIGMYGWLLFGGMLCSDPSALCPVPFDPFSLVFLFILLYVGVASRKDAIQQVKGSNISRTKRLLLISIASLPLAIFIVSFVAMLGILLFILFSA